MLGILQRHKWWVLSAAVVGTLLGYIAAKLVPVKYVADSTVWIETRDRDNSERTSGPIRPGGFLESRQWPELLQSYIVLDSVVNKQRLYLRSGRGTDPEFLYGLRFDDRFGYGTFRIKIEPDGRNYTLARFDRAAGIPFLRELGFGANVIERGAVTDSVGRALGWRWVLDPKLVEKGKAYFFDVTTPREASQNLLARTAMRVEGQQFIRLSLTDGNPKRAAATLNTMVDEFVGVATRLKKSKLVEQRDILAEQTEFAYSRLKEKELELENFKIKTVTLPSLSTPVAPGLQMTQPTVMTDYFAKKRQLDELRRDRQAILDLLARSERGEMTVDAFQTIPAVANAPDLKSALTELSVAETELRAARLRYTDSLKPVRDLNERIANLRLNAIPTLARALGDQLERSARTLEQRIADDSRELAQIPERVTTEQRLLRDYEAADALYKTLRARLEAAGLAEASEIPDLRRLDPAVPPRRPAGIPKPLIMLAGTLLAAAAAGGYFVAKDFLDRRINYPEQVSGGNIGLSILGVVPDARPGRGVDDKELASQVVEAFREIRLNIVHSFNETGPLALTVSSPSPQDGKSFVTANLAMSFAEAGYRTLIIDGDTRRGTLHSVFRVGRRPGLIDHLVGGAPLDTIIRATSHPDLSLIPCGEWRSQSPELLGNAQMRQLYDTVRTNYDVVLFDSPPFSAGIDSYLLGALTGSLLTVMRSGQTDRELAEAKLRLLDRLPIRPIGAVLNAVSLRSASYRNYSYLYGYAAEDTEPKKLGESKGAPSEPVSS